LAHASPWRLLEEARGDATASWDGLMEDQDVSPFSLFAREHGLEAEVEASYLSQCRVAVDEQQNKQRLERST
jgi:hypothetical protein